MLKLGLCCGGGLCCALLGGALWLRGGATVLGEAAELVADKTVACAKAGCTKAGCEKHVGAKAPCAMSGGEVQDVNLTADEKKVVAYIADAIEDGELPMIDSEELAEKKDRDASVREIREPVQSAQNPLAARPSEFESRLRHHSTRATRARSWLAAAH